MELNYYLIFAVALIPLVIGSLWYSPMLFNNAWMKASGVTEESMKGANMFLIFGLTYVFSLMLSLLLVGLVIHQTQLYSLFVGLEGPETTAFLNDFMAKYGDIHRTFTHGMVHGGFLTIFFFLPMFAINALFERKSWKYIAINVGFWFVCLVLMGGTICAFM